MFSVSILRGYGFSMPRIARAILAGEPHHVTQRGTYRQPVFKSDTGRSKYLAPATRETWPTQETKPINRTLSPLNSVWVFGRIFLLRSDEISAYNTKSILNHMKSLVLGAIYE